MKLRFRITDRINGKLLQVSPNSSILFKHPDFPENICVFDMIDECFTDNDDVSEFRFKIEQCVEGKWIKIDNVTHRSL